MGILDPPREGEIEIIKGLDRPFFFFFKGLFKKKRNILPLCPGDVTHLQLAQGLQEPCRNHVL